MQPSDAHTDAEAVKAMLDQENLLYTPEPTHDTEVEARQDEIFENLPKSKRKSLFGRAKSLIKNDAISRIFHLNSTDKVCIVSTFKKITGLVLGTGILAAPAITLWFAVGHYCFDPFGKPGIQAASCDGSHALQEVFRWSVILSLSWAVYWSCNLFFHVLPGLIRGVFEAGVLRSLAWLKGHLSPHTEQPSCQNACANVLDERASLSAATWRSITHFIALSPYITNVIVSVVFSWAVRTLVGTYDMYVIVQPDGKPQEPKWASAKFYLLNVPTGLFIFSVAFLMEKWAIQHLAVYFHSRNYEKRIEESNFALSTLHIIRSRIKTWRKWQAQQANRRKHEDSHPQSPTLVPISMSDFTKDTVSTGDSEAIAQDVFDTLRQAAYMCCKERTQMDGPRDHLVEDDFYPFCKTADAAKRFARMLDQDGNGDLTRREMLDGISRIYDERDHLAQSLSCNSNYIQRLDGLLLTIFLLCASFYWLSTFDPSIWHSFTAIGGIALGLKFAFESSVSSTFISIIFALVMHPYDIGDIIVLDNAIGYTVLDVDLWTTTLNSPNGLVYVPNLTLAESIIGNVRRSEWQLDTMQVRITAPPDPKMLKPLLSRLESRLVDFAKANPRDYMPNPRIRNLDFESSTTHAFQLIIPYKSNFYDVRLTDERRRGFAMRILGVLAELDIEQAPINKDWGRVLSLP